MPLPAAALATALTLAARDDLQLEAGLLTVGRTRTSAPSGGPATTTTEAVLQPRVSAALTGPDVGVALAYRPRLFAPDLLGWDRPDVLHVADVRTTLRLDPAWGLAVVAEGARGTTDMLTESRRAAVPDLQTITTRQLVRYRSARADLRLDGGLGARTTLGASAGWFLDGGEDAPSRALVPIERGVRGDAALRFSATPRDQLEGRLDWTGTQLLARTTSLARLIGTWRRRVSPTLEAWAGGGAIGAVERQGGGTSRQVFPAAELGASDAARPNLSEELVARLGAYVDRGTGDVARQLEAVATVRWSFARAWSLSARGAAAARRTPAEEVRRVSFATFLAWAKVEHVTVGGGVYGDWQAVTATGLPSFYEGGLFLALSADTAAGAPPRGFTLP